MPDPEDLLSDSLECLYDFSPISLSSAGLQFIYTCPESMRRRLTTIKDEYSSATRWEVTPPHDIVLVTPDTQPANWSLHASAIWMSSLYIADHLDDLQLDQHMTSLARKDQVLRVLELGAGAGLLSILIAKCYHGVHVVSSDYPDEALINTLAENVARNGAAERCCVASYAWGSDPSALFSAARADNLRPVSGFDVVIAADTLWNPEFHPLFVEALRLTLKKTAESRIYLTAGLHTGAYTINAFLRLAESSGFDIQFAEEREVHGEVKRPWCLEVAQTHDEQERRRWVVWVVLRWKSLSVQLRG